MENLNNRYRTGDMLGMKFRDDLMPQFKRLYISKKDSLYQVLDVYMDKQELTFVKLKQLDTNYIMDFPLMFMDNTFVNYGKIDVKTLGLLYGKKN